MLSCHILEKYAELALAWPNESTSTVYTNKSLSVDLKVSLIIFIYNLLAAFFADQWLSG